MSPFTSRLVRLSNTDFFSSSYCALWRHFSFRLFLSMTDHLHPHVWRARVPGRSDSELLHSPFGQTRFNPRFQLAIYACTHAHGLGLFS